MRHGSVVTVRETPGLRLTDVIALMLGEEPDA
jgi:hypothetical protein